MKKGLLFFICAALLMAGLPASANDFASWRAGVLAQAARDGVPEETLKRAAPYLTYEAKVIDLDQRQPEKTQTFREYLAATVTPQRVARARAEFQNNAELLQGIEREYGVPAEVIVALWAKESDFGRYQGNFNILTALSSLAYEGRRRSFFEGELIAAMRLLAQQDMNPAELSGSWAGAMGQCQFMPSSYLRFAADGDGDGKADIWGNQADVFASIANYLSKSGWDYSAGIAQSVALPTTFQAVAIEQKLEKPVSEWHALGVVRPSGDVLFLSGAPAVMVQPDGQGSQAYLTYDNFKVLMRWNRSTYFGLAIASLADQINPKLKAQKP